jgi:hypothetical protein
MAKSISSNITDNIARARKKMKLIMCLQTNAKTMTVTTVKYIALAHIVPPSDVYVNLHIMGSSIVNNTGAFMLGMSLRNH